jgi:hypothetical protein
MEGISKTEITIRILRCAPRLLLLGELFFSATTVRADTMLQLESQYTKYAHAYNSKNFLAFRILLMLDYFVIEH